MSRSTDDGAHEVWILHLFADGSGGGGSECGKLPVTVRADGTEILYAERELRDPNGVVAWQAACVREGTGDIHWRGPRWTRESAPFAWSATPGWGEAIADAERRSGYSEDGYAHEADTLGDAITAPWDDHIRPQILTNKQLRAALAAYPDDLPVAVWAPDRDGVYDEYAVTDGPCYGQFDSGDGRGLRRDDTHIAIEVSTLYRQYTREQRSREA